MNIINFVNSFLFLLKSHDKQLLQDIYFDDSSGKIKKKSWIGILYSKIASCFIPSDEEKQLKSILEKLSAYYFGKDLSEAELGKHLGKIKKGTFFEGFSYRSLQALIQEKIKLMKHATGVKSSAQDLLYIEYLETIINFLTRLITPDLSFFLGPKREKYEKAVRDLLSSDSIWLTITTKEIKQIQQSLKCKKISTIIAKMPANLWKKIAHIKSIEAPCQEILVHSIELQKYGTTDFRFELKELKDLVDIAQFFTFSTQAKNVYSTYFTQIALQKLHPMVLKKYGEIQEESLSLEQLEYAFKLSKENFHWIDDIIASEVELVEKQKLTASILYGSFDKLDLGENTIYPFTCTEMKSLLKKTDPIENFSRMHIKQICSVATYMQNLTDEDSKNIYKEFSKKMNSEDIKRYQDIFGSKDEKNRAILRQDFFQHLPPLLQEEVHQYFISRQLLEKFEKDFLKRENRIGKEKQELRIEIPRQEQEVYTFNGEKIKEYLKRRYSRFWITELECKYPELFNKKEETPIDPKILVELRQKETDLFWRTVSRKYYKQIQNSEIKRDYKVLKELLQNRRRMIRNIFNEKLASYHQDDFTQQTSPQKIGQESNAIGLRKEPNAIYYLDDQICYLGCSQNILLYKTPEVIAKKSSNPVFFGKTTQCIEVDLEKDQGYFILYDQLMVNDQAGPVLQDTIKFLKSA